MAMSTMLYHENPPLRNEAPVDLATRSPMPGLSGKVSELLRCCVIPRQIHLHDMKIYSRPYHNNTQLPEISQLPCHLHHPQIRFITLPGQSLDSVLQRAPACFGSRRERHSFFWLPRPLFCWPRRTSPLRLLTLLDKLIRSSPYRLIQKVNPHPQKCLPLSPPTSPSLTAAPRSSLAMSTAPLLFPSRLSVT
jgi:hypothetical protein